MKIRHSHGMLVDGQLHFINHMHELETWGHAHVFRPSGDFRAKRIDYERWLRDGGSPNEDMVKRAEKV